MGYLICCLFIMKEKICYKKNCYERKTAHYSQFYRQFCEKLTHDWFFKCKQT